MLHLGRPVGGLAAPRGHRVLGEPEQDRKYIDRKKISKFYCAADLSSGTGPCGMSMTGCSAPDFLEPAMERLSPMKPGLISPWYIELGFM